MPARFTSRDEVATALRARGIETGIHYAPAMDGHPALEGIATVSGEIPAAQAWAAEELSLPMHPDLKRRRGEFRRRVRHRGRHHDGKSRRGKMLRSAVEINQPQDAATTSEVGVAVVGLGYWGPNLLRVLGDNLDASVKWICDLDTERLEKYRRRHPGARVTTRIDRVLADPAVDAVIIATPVHTHYHLAALVLEAGKHVFVEKPLAPSSELADELAEIARERKRILMCGHTFLYSPPVRAIKRMIAEGKLGDIYFISSSRVNLGLHQRDVSVIWDLGPHDFSILLYWLSEMPTTVRAVGRDSIVKGIPDVAFVTMTFDSGIIANIELSWLAPSKLRRTVLVGSERMAIYDDGAPEPVRLFDQGVVYRDPETFGSITCPTGPAT